MFGVQLNDHGYHKPVEAYPERSASPVAGLRQVSDVRQAEVNPLARIQSVLNHRLAERLEEDIGQLKESLGKGMEDRVEKMVGRVSRNRDD